MAKALSFCCPRLGDQRCSLCSGQQKITRARELRQDFPSSWPARDAPANCSALSSLCWLPTQTSRSPETPPFPYAKNAQSCLSLASSSSSNLLPRLTVIYHLSSVRHEAWPKHNVCPGSQLVPVGCRRRKLPCAWAHSQASSLAAGPAE